MAIKPKHRRRIYWTLASLVGALFLAAIIIPPMINLNKFRPMIETAIKTQMSVPAQLNGDINFSLVGGTTIVAHDVVVPNARIGAVMLSVPFRDMFNMERAQLKSRVIVYDADITIEKLEPAAFNHEIEIYNSNISFMQRNFHIVRAKFSNGEFRGTVRTADHKYDLEFIGDTFYIRNRNNNLEIIGQMYSDGSIRGTISVETHDINSWFGFSEPKLNRTFPMTMNFELLPGGAYNLTNIQSDEFSGNIYINADKTRDIQFVSDGTSFDLSFLTRPSSLYLNTKYNLDLYGDLRFHDYKFKHVRINAGGTSDKMQITNLIADDIAITGGTITSDGAHNIMITMPINDTNIMCMFSGTPDSWTCSEFTYGNMHGNISVTGDTYVINVESDTPKQSDDKLLEYISQLGTHGTINFRFSDSAGTYTVTPNETRVHYTRATDKNLRWLNTDLPFLPEYILSEPGDFSWTNDTLTFTPHSRTWQLSVHNNYFELTGHSFKTWLPNVDLTSINDAPYTVSGYYNNGNISNLKIVLSGHEFRGSASGANITLSTDVLSVDTFMNRAFIDNFSELEFRTNLPILNAFNLPVNISLTATQMIYNGNTYQNFVYSLRDNTQTFSISDTSRGNILATIDRDNTNYTIFAQLNRFVINGELLSSQMPINIRDTMITGEVSLTTSGQIAHDIFYNMRGKLDLTFSDGYLIGLSLDDFYASASNITTLNAEYALARAFSGGETRIKQMHIIGDYDNGNFITTSPMTLSIRHTDAVGGLAITDGFMTGELDLTMRGTSPTPTTIGLSILPDGTREYSLSEIMREFDADFLRAFTKTHDRF